MSLRTQGFFEQVRMDFHPDPLLTFVNLPMPPSTNHMYITLRNGMKFPSPELKAFQAEMETRRKGYPDQNERFPSQGEPLSLELQFFLNAGRLLKKDGTTKRWDVSNRIKAMEDAVAKLIGVDDRHFWEVYAAKRVTTGPERVEARVYRIKSFEKFCKNEQGAA